MVRLKLMSLKLNPSRQVSDAADLWGFHGPEVFNKAKLLVYNDAGGCRRYTGKSV